MTDLERLARVIGECYDGCADPVDTPNNWGRAMEAARAVLTALREPSNAVLDAGADNLVGSIDDDWRGDALIIWRAMIDSILSETE